MDSRMSNQIESQPKRHRILVNGHEVYSGDVLLEALQHYNHVRERFLSYNIEFKSVCTNGEGQ